jgi:hypothetical protein
MKPLISLAYLASFHNFSARIRVIAVALFLHFCRSADLLSLFFAREGGRRGSRDGFDARTVTAG